MCHLVHALAHDAGNVLKARTRLKAQEQHLELVAGIVLLDEVEQAAVNQLGIGGSLLVVDDGFGQELPEARVGIEGLVTAVLLFETLSATSSCLRLNSVRSLLYAMASSIGLRSSL